MTKLAVLVSGTGTILEAMLASGLKISLVLADRSCRGLHVAEAAGVPIELIERAEYGHTFDRTSYTKKVVAALERAEINFVAMAGFMTVLAEPIFTRYEGKIINTHPSLLPAFKGENAVSETLKSGVKVTGCTIHVATLELDSGPIIAQGVVPVEPGDTVHTLQERIKQVERKLYPATIRQLLANANSPKEPA